MHFRSTSQAQQQNFPFTLHWTCFHFRFDLAAGLLKTCFIPPPLVMWVLRFWAVSAIQGESNWVVSWSTKWVYLVRPDRPKFLTWKNKWFNTVEIILFYAVLFLSWERSACMLHVYQITACPIYFLWLFKTIYRITKYLKLKKVHCKNYFYRERKLQIFFHNNLKEKNPNANPTDGNPMKVLECSTSEIPMER